MPPGLNPWEDAGNARRYAEFARRYPMYRLTSRHLVDAAGLAPDARVVDLACGTGVTTAAVLAALGDRGPVVAVDGSAAMLGEAHRDLAASHPEPRTATWLTFTATAERPTAERPTAERRRGRT